MRYFTVLSCTWCFEIWSLYCSTFQFGPATTQMLNGCKYQVYTMIDSVAVDCELYRQDWCSSWSLLCTIDQALDICEIELKYNRMKKLSRELFSGFAQYI